MVLVLPESLDPHRETLCNSRSRATRSTPSPIWFPSQVHTGSSSPWMGSSDLAAAPATPGFILIIDSCWSRHQVQAPHSEKKETENPRVCLGSPANSVSCTSAELPKHPSHLNTLTASPHIFSHPLLLPLPSLGMMVWFILIPAPAGVLEASASV